MERDQPEATFSTSGLGRRIAGVYKKALTWSDTTGLRAGSEIPNTLLELGTTQFPSEHPAFFSSFYLPLLIFLLGFYLPFFPHFLFFKLFFRSTILSFSSLLFSSLLLVQLYRLQEHA